MALIVDAGPLLALADRASPDRTQVRNMLTEETGPLVLPAYVAAEVDHLLRRRFGEQVERRFLQDLAARQFEVEMLTPEEYGIAVDVDDRTPGLGLADLSIVVLAARYRTRRILTFDQRDFRRVPPLDGGSFVILPADAG
jgi:uncharacterized protein